jgi:glycosyltransferase involved in cell wall biosynthesis
MPLLYRCAKVLAFPSLFEGFGLPILEAQACGTPVVCADATALPEVAGRGALLVDPVSVDAWTQALAQVLADDALRRALITEGHANEARFTWERTARQTLAALEAAAAAR